MLIYADTFTPKRAIDNAGQYAECVPRTNGTAALTIYSLAEREAHNSAPGGLVIYTGTPAHCQSMLFDYVEQAGLGALLWVVSVRAAAIIV